MRGHRTSWDPRPVAVEVGDCSFLDGLPFRDARLANAFHVSGVDYRWDRGRVLTTAGVRT